MSSKYYVIYGYTKGNDVPYMDTIERHCVEVRVDSYVTLEAAMDGWSTLLQFRKAVCDYYSKFLQEPGEFLATYRMYVEVFDDNHHRVEREMVAECEVLPIPDR